MKLNKTARDWLRKEGACSECVAWAERSGETLRDLVPLARPDWALWVLFRPGVLTDRELWLIACHVAEMALPIWYAWAPDDHRPRTAIETRRLWLDGLATDDDLLAAELAAELAVELAELAADSAESAAELAWSAWSAALSAARSAADSTAWSTAWLAARSAAWLAVWSTAWESGQVKWILENCSPGYVDDPK
jgi:hypothetical protein